MSVSLSFIETHFGRTCRTQPWSCGENDIVVQWMEVLRFRRN